MKQTLFALLLLLPFTGISQKHFIDFDYGAQYACPTYSDWNGDIMGSAGHFTSIHYTRRAGPLFIGVIGSVLNSYTIERLHDESYYFEAPGPEVVPNYWRQPDMWDAVFGLAITVGKQWQLGKHQFAAHALGGGVGSNLPGEINIHREGVQLGVRMQYAYMVTEHFGVSLNPAYTALLWQHYKTTHMPSLQLGLKLGI